MQKILIVDDIPVNVEILSDLLERPTYQLVSAFGGAEALEKVHEQNPDLILLDVSMPEVDGYQVCAELKQDPRVRHIPIIFVTAHTDVEDEAYGLSLGAVDYITKPLSPPIVLARVHTHLEMKKRWDLMASKCDIDALTGIGNRRFFDSTILLEWAHAIRNKTPVSLVMLDIDYFKSINDEYGHMVGDDCLRQAATAFEASLDRDVDIIARYGGEEFACILPDTEFDGALKVAERLRQAVMDLNIQYVSSHVKRTMTISAGVATARPESGHHYRELIQAADDALYQAKNSGRNCVVADSRAKS